MAISDVAQRKSITLKLWPSDTAENTARFVEEHNVMVPAQLNEPGGHGGTFAVNLSALHRDTKQYVDKAVATIAAIDQTTIWADSNFPGHGSYGMTYVKTRCYPNGVDSPIIEALVRRSQCYSYHELVLKAEVKPTSRRIGHYSASSLYYEMATNWNQMNCSSDNTIRRTDTVSRVSYDKFDRSTSSKYITSTILVSCVRTGECFSETQRFYSANGQDLAGNIWRSGACFGLDTGGLNSKRQINLTSTWHYDDNYIYSNTSTTWEFCNAGGSINIGFGGPGLGGSWGRRLNDYGDFNGANWETLNGTYDFAGTGVFGIYGPQLDVITGLNNGLQNGHKIQHQSNVFYEGQNQIAGSPFWEPVGTAQRFSGQLINSLNNQRADYQTLYLGTCSDNIYTKIIDTSAPSNNYIMDRQYEFINIEHQSSTTNGFSNLWDNYTTSTVQRINSIINNGSENYMANVMRSQEVFSNQGAPTMPYCLGKQHEWTKWSYLVSDGGAGVGCVYAAFRDFSRVSVLCGESMPSSGSLYTNINHNRMSVINRGIASYIRESVCLSELGVFYQVNFPGAEFKMTNVVNDPGARISLYADAASLTLEPSDNSLRITAPGGVWLNGTKQW